MSIDSVNKPLSSAATTGVLYRKIFGIVSTQLIYVAAELNLADLIHESPKSIEELAILTSTVPDRLYRVMRSLESIGLFRENDSKKYEMTPAAVLLCSDSEESLRDYALMFGASWHVNAWSHILHSLKSEESSMEGFFDKTLYEYLEQNRVASETFNNAMTSMSKHEAVDICEAFDFENYELIVDVCGGEGFLLSTILNNNARSKGILFDLPKVLDAGKNHIKINDLSKRCVLVQGDVFNQVPADGDLYMLKYILHNWDDKRALDILRNCKKAMKPSSRLLIIEAIIPDGQSYSNCKLADIEMMVLTSGGRERSRDEYTQLFSEAGLKISNIIPANPALSLIEGELDI